MAAGSLTVREIVTRWGFKVDQKAIRDFDKSLNRLKRTAKTVAIAFGAAAVGVGFFINEAAKFEQTEIAFETLIGNVEVSKRKLEELFAFARKTPFTIPSVLREAKRFLAFGFGVEELIPTLDLVGNIAASVGTDKLPFIVKALADVRGASRLMGREVLQFINAGVAIIPILEKELGKNSATIKKMIEQGAISFETVLKVLNKLPAVTNRLMARQAKTFLGIISNIQDGLIVMSIAIGEAVLPQVKALAREFLTYIDVNKKMIQARAIEFMKSLAKSVLSFIRFMRNLIKVLNSIVKLFGGWERVIRGVTFALLGLLAVNFLSFLGSGVILLGKFVIMLGKARVGALLLQASFAILPLVVGAALVGVILAIEDFVSFLQGGKVTTIGIALGLGPQAGPNLLRELNKIKNSINPFSKENLLFRATEFLGQKLFPTQEEFDVGVTKRETASALKKKKAKEKENLEDALFLAKQAFINRKFTEEFEARKNIQPTRNIQPTKRTPISIGKIEINPQISDGTDPKKFGKELGESFVEAIEAISPTASRAAEPDLRSAIAR